MEYSNFVLSIVAFVVAVSCLVLAIPLVKQKVPMNRFYGVRFPYCFKSEENWYRVNRVGGLILAGWSAPVFIVAFLSLLIPAKSPDSPLYYFYLAAPFLFVLAAFLHTVIWVGRLKSS